MPFALIPSVLGLYRFPELFILLDERVYPFAVFVRQERLRFEMVYLSSPSYLLSVHVVEPVVSVPYLQSRIYRELGIVLMESEAEPDDVVPVVRVEFGEVFLPREVRTPYPSRVAMPLHLVEASGTDDYVVVYDHDVISYRFLDSLVPSVVDEFSFYRDDFVRAEG